MAESNGKTGGLQLIGENGNKYRLLAQLLTGDPNFAQILAEVTPASQHDKLGDSLTNISMQVGSSLAIIRSLINMEYKSKLKQPTTILRVNSIVSKMIGRYSKIVGIPFLKTLLTGLVSDIYARPEVDMELEREKIKADNADTLVQTNTVLVKVECQKFIDKITSGSMLDEVPRELRAICYIMSESGKLHNLEHLTLPLVSGFIILRFICSAISVPNNYGVAASMPKDNVRKNLILITKIITKLANNEKFDSEVHLVPLNDFLESNRQQLMDWLSELSKDPKGQSPPFSDLMSNGSFEGIELKSFDNKDFSLIQGLIYDNGHKLITALHKDALLNNEHKKSAAQDSKTGSKSLIDVYLEFVALVRDLYVEPKAPEGEKKDEIVKKKDSFKDKTWDEIEMSLSEKTMDALMEHGTKASFTEIARSRFLYLGKPTKANMPVIYIIMSRLTTQLLKRQDDILMYLFKTLSSTFAQRYVVVVDLSWGELNEEQQVLLYRGFQGFSRIAPRSFFENCHQIYLLHPNFKTRIMCEDFLNFITPARRKMLVQIAYDWVDLREVIEPNNVWIPFLSKRFTPIAFHVIKNNRANKRERQFKITHDSVLDIDPKTWTVKSEILFSKIVEIRTRGNELVVSYSKETMDERNARGCEYITKTAYKGDTKSVRYACYTEQQLEVLSDTLYEAAVHGVSISSNLAYIVNRETKPNTTVRTHIKFTADSILMINDRKKIFAEIPYSTVQSSYVDEKDPSSLYVIYLLRGHRKTLIFHHDRALDMRTALLDSIRRFRFSISLERDMLYRTQYDIIMDAMFTAAKISNSHPDPDGKWGQICPVEMLRGELKKFYKIFKPKGGRAVATVEYISQTLETKLNLVFQQDFVQHLVAVWDPDRSNSFMLEDIVKSWVSVRREKLLLQKKQQLLSKRK